MLCSLKASSMPSISSPSDIKTRHVLLWRLCKGVDDLKCNLKTVGECKSEFSDDLVQLQVGTFGQKQYASPNKLGPVTVKFDCQRDPFNSGC